MSFIENFWGFGPFSSLETRTPPTVIIDHLKPLLATVSLSELRREYPVVDLYFQINAYDQLFTAIFNEYFSYVAQMSNTLLPEQIDALLLKCDELAAMQDFAELLLSQLDILGTIDHVPSGDSSFQKRFPGQTPVQVWRKFVRDYPQKDIRTYHSFEKPVAYIDTASDLLRRMSLHTRRTYSVQRVLNAILTAHRKGWFIVFDTLSLRNDSIRDFYQDKNALRNHFRTVGRLVLTAEGRPHSDKMDDCFQYFCAPEFGEQNGRLHFHAVYLLRTLPRGTRDPNFGRRVRNHRQLLTLQGVWKYGFSAPIGVRYHQDAYTKLGWLWPVDKKGQPIPSKPSIAVGFYVTKYVNKKADQDMIRLNIGGHAWNQHLSRILQNLPSHTFRIRMSRGFGLELPPMEHLSMSSLSELTNLSLRLAPLSSLLKRNARKILRSRLGALSLSDILASKPKTIPLLKSLRRLMHDIPAFNPQSFTDMLTPKLTGTDISDETRHYLVSNRLTKDFFVRPRFTGGCK